MLLREDGHTRLTEKVTSEERPEAGEGVMLGLSVNDLEGDGSTCVEGRC